MTTSTGKCHCGQVEWTVKLDNETSNHILCHCDTCKQLSGGAYTLNQIVPEDAIKVTKGSLKSYSYKGDSGNAVDCFYCPNCTSHAYHHQHVMGPKLVARTILLDNGKSLKPGAEIYGKMRLPWQQEVAQTFETTPPE